MADFLLVFISGLINGSIYALIAMGLSLQYGVAKVLNIAHGEFIMFTALWTYTLYTFFHINPYLAVLIAGPAVLIVGFFLHSTLFRYLKAKSENPAVFEGNSMLAAFGLLFIIDNIAILTWGSQVHGYTFLIQPVSIGGAPFSLSKLITWGVAVAIGVIFFAFLSWTRPGKAIRVAAQDPETAGLMGVNINFVLALCFGLGALLAGLAGVLISTYNVALGTSIGLQYTLIALIVVVLGGLGSIPGSFIGGIILGLVGSIVTKYAAGLVLAAFYFIFMVMLIIRPKGLLGK